MSPQIGLLGGLPEPDAAAVVPPAPPLDALVALGAELPEGLALGPSSWAYPGWGRRVWARDHSEALLSRHGLAAVEAFPVFGAVGVDRTFHAPVEAAAMARWARQAPALRFVVKATARLTRPLDDAGAPSAPFLQAEEAARTVGPAVEGLGGQLAHVLLQFAASATRDAGGRAAFLARLQGLLAALPAGARPAVELRDPALVSGRVRDLLAEVGAVACLNVQPGMPPLDAQAAALLRPDAPLVVRWMTRPGLTYAQARAAYAPFTHLRGADPATRRALARLAVRHLDRGQPVVVTIANRAEGCIPLSAAGLAEEVVRIKRRRGRR